jgi:hypothetical protein
LRKFRLRYVPSSGFFNLSTVFSTIGFAGLLHPAATSRVLSVQGFLPCRSPPDSSSVGAPVPFSHQRSPASRLPRSCKSTSRRWSAKRCVPRGRGLALPSVAPLFGFAPPSGSRSTILNPVPRALRSWRFPSRSSPEP